MRKYLEDFWKEFDYPQEGAEALLLAFDRIHERPETAAEFRELLSCYEADRMYDFGKLLERAAAVSEKCGVHPYTGKLLLLCGMSKQLKQYYEEEGIAESIWKTSMYDLKYKLIECKSVHDIYGTFVAGWFVGFFQLWRFGFCKLQFEMVDFKRTYEKNGVSLAPQSKVINVHIPRTGTKLDRESMQRSYAEAAAFYRKQFGMERVVFVCHSWLLFPKNKEILSPQSNLYAFISDFDIIESEEYDNYGEIWRLFDVFYDGNPDHLPQDSSLRRGYADWIRKGIKTGCAYGVYVYPF